MPNNRIPVEFDEKKIDAIFAEVDQCHKPGAAAGIAIDGKPVYRKGFGLANMELPAVLSPSIRMRIYSMTKHFACLAYMLLCEDGKAGIDDPIGKHVPELHAATRNAAVRQLMGHTSGIRDASDICWQFSGTGLPTATSPALVALYRDIDDVNTAPGATYNYNNGAYLLLTEAIERLSGKTFEDLLYERIFAPVGMFNTMLRRRDTDFIPNSATMHMSTAEGGYTKSWLGNMAGEGGIISTVDDMLRWTKHMDAPVVGSAATWTLMKTPQTLANGTSTDYGLGLHTGAYRGLETVQHSGGGMGANSQMIKLPAAGLDIVIMVNRHDVSGVALANRIIDACIPGLEPLREAGSGKVVSGVFCSPKTKRVVKLGPAPKATPMVKEGQQVGFFDAMEIPLEPGDNGSLRPIAEFDMFKVSVTPVGGDEPASIRLGDFGNVDELVRQKPATETAIGHLAGRYSAPATGTEATIFDADGGARIRTVGRFGAKDQKLENLAEGIWRARTSDVMPWGGTLVFEPDGKAFYYSSGRTTALRFQRVG